MFVLVDFDITNEIKPNIINTISTITAVPPGVLKKKILLSNK